MLPPFPKPAGAPPDLSGGLAIERAFNTWSSDHPLAMHFAPLGLSLTPVAFAASLGKATTFRSGPGIRLGRHALDGALIEASVEHGGTAIDWRYAKHDPFTVAGAWRATRFGEWGLRFWVSLVLETADGRGWVWDKARGAALTRVGHRYGAVVPDRAPLMVTGHADIATLTAEFETKGYFFLESRALEAPALALRFNLEEAPEARFGFAVGDDPDETIARARKALRADEPAIPTHTGFNAGALDAVRDVMAWNTVFDAVNRRPYTALSRNWTHGKFGGFGVWLNDILFNALLCGAFDADAARDNLDAVLAAATPQGNFPCLITGNDAWIDRSQPPIAALIVHMLEARLGDRTLADRALPALVRNHDWWWRARDPAGTGLVVYGTSAFGAGLYRGTKLAAKDESSMDNSPTHDEATLDPATGLLDCHDVGLNALLALDGEMIAAMLRDRGMTSEAARFEARTMAHKAAIRERLWDGERRVFANRLTNGRFVASLAPTSFYPLVAGIPTGEQVDGLIAQLTDPAGFGGEFRLPSCRRDDPAYSDNVYWRGRVWPPLNWWVTLGLRRMGRAAEASALAADSFALFKRNWDTRRHAPENFSAETGEATDQPDTDTFYAWGALMPALAVAEIIDVNPFEGFAVANSADVRLGPVETPAGRLRVIVETGVLRLERGEDTLLSTDIKGRITRIAFPPDRVTLVLPAGAPGGVISLSRSVRSATQGAEGARVEGRTVHLAPCPDEKARQVVIDLA